MISSLSEQYLSIFIIILIDVCKLFRIGAILNLTFGKGLSFFTWAFFFFRPEKKDCWFDENWKKSLTLYKKAKFGPSKIVKRQKDFYLFEKILRKKEKILEKASFILENLCNL